MSLLLFALAAILLLVVIPIAEPLFSKRDEIMQKKYNLEKLRKVSGQYVSLEGKRTAFNEHVTTRQEFFKEENTALAGAKIQTKLRRFASSNEVAISTIKTLPTIDEGVQTTVEMRISASGEKNGILNFIQDIERSSPYLFIDGLEMRPERTQKTSSIIDLQVEFKVSGFLLNSEIAP